MRSTLLGPLNRGSYRDRLLERINKILDHGSFIDGPEVGFLEQTMAKFTRSKYAIATSSGTDALILALREIGVNGEKVAVPAFSFIATASAVLHAAGEVVFVDVREDDFTINFDLIPDGVEIVVAVDIFGVPAHYSKSGLMIVSDAAQSMGSKLNGNPCGSFGDISCTSFYPTKSLGAYGDAGMIFTNETKYVEGLRRLRNHGEAGRYVHYDIGYNARMDSIQAAVLLTRLEEFGFENTMRQAIADRYRDKIKGVQFQTIRDGVDWNASYFPVLLDSESARDRIYYEVDNTTIHYPMALHEQECFKYLGHKEGDFPVAEDISNRIVCLPIGPYFDINEQDKVIWRVNDVT